MPRRAERAAGPVAAPLASPAGPRAPGQGGMALIAVMVFALIVALIGLAFFSVASYETRGSLYRQRSSEAFYLADGGIARARGELMDDVAWRGPVAGAPLGSGNYDVSVADTVLGGQNALVLRSEGRVGNAARGIEATGSLRTFLEEWGMVALGNIDVGGNITVTGNIHSGGDAYFGPGDVYLKSGSYDEGYTIEPPPIRTEPEAFGPATTYYRVIGSNSPKTGRIFKYDWPSGGWQLLPSTTWFSPSMVKLTSGNYTFTFQDADTKKYFDTVFLKDPGSVAVVVDFGQPDSTGLSTANLSIAMSDGAWRLRATIINTRFEGMSESDRVAPCSGYWKGGTVTFKPKLIFAPDNCVAMIVHGLGSTTGQQPNASGSLGTQNHPALTYVTGNVNGIKGDLDIWGALIALCDISTQGGPTVHQVPGIEDCLPFDFKTRGSGFFHLREWREVPL